MFVQLKIENEVHTNNNRNSKQMNEKTNERENK